MFGPISELEDDLQNKMTGSGTSRICFVDFSGSQLKPYGRYLNGISVTNLEISFLEESTPRNLLRKKNSEKLQIFHMIFYAHVI